MARTTVTKSSKSYGGKRKNSTAVTNSRQISYDSSSSDDAPVVVAALTGKNAVQPNKTKESRSSKRSVARGEKRSVESSDEDAPSVRSKPVERSDDEENHRSRRSPGSDVPADSEVEDVQVQTSKARKGRSRPSTKAKERSKSDSVRPPASVSATGTSRQRAAHQAKRSAAFNDLIQSDKRRDASSEDDSGDGSETEVSEAIVVATHNGAISKKGAAKTSKASSTTDRAKEKRKAEQEREEAERQAQRAQERAEREAEKLREEERNLEKARAKERERQAAVAREKTEAEALEREARRQQRKAEKAAEKEAEKARALEEARKRRIEQLEEEERQAEEEARLRRKARERARREQEREDAEEDARRAKARAEAKRRRELEDQEEAEEEARRAKAREKARKKREREEAKDAQEEEERRLKAEARAERKREREEEERKHASTSQSTSKQSSKRKSKSTSRQSDDDEEDFVAETSDLELREERRVGKTSRRSSSPSAKPSRISRSERQSATPLVKSKTTLTSSIMAHSAPKRRKIDVEEEAKDAVESEDESESEDEMSIVVASGSKHREKKARHDESRSKHSRTSSSSKPIKARKSASASRTPSTSRAASTDSRRRRRSIPVIEVSSKRRRSSISPEKNRSRRSRNAAETSKKSPPAIRVRQDSSSATDESEGEPEPRRTSKKTTSPKINGKHAVRQSEEATLTALHTDSEPDRSASKQAQEDTDAEDFLDLPPLTAPKEPSMSVEPEYNDNYEPYAMDGEMEVHADVEEEMQPVARTKSRRRAFASASAEPESPPEQSTSRHEQMNLPSQSPEASPHAKKKSSSSRARKSTSSRTVKIPRKPRLASSEAPASTVGSEGEEAAASVSTATRSTTPPQEMASSPKRISVKQEKKEKKAREAKMLAREEEERTVELYEQDQDSSDGDSLVTAQTREHARVVSPGKESKKMKKSKRSDRQSSSAPLSEADPLPPQQETIEAIEQEEQLLEEPRREDSLTEPEPDRKPQRSQSSQSVMTADAADISYEAAETGTTEDAVGDGIDRQVGDEPAATHSPAQPPEDDRDFMRSPSYVQAEATEAIMADETQLEPEPAATIADAQPVAARDSEITETERPAVAPLAEDSTGTSRSAAPSLGLTEIIENNAFETIAEPVAAGDGDAPAQEAFGEEVLEDDQQEGSESGAHASQPVSEAEAPLSATDVAGERSTAIDAGPAGLPVDSMVAAEIRQKLAEAEDISAPVSPPSRMEEDPIEQFDEGDAQTADDIEDDAAAFPPPEDSGLGHSADDTPLAQLEEEDISVSHFPSDDQYTAAAAAETLDEEDREAIAETVADPAPSVVHRQTRRPRKSTAPHSADADIKVPSSDTMYSHNKRITRSASPIKRERQAVATAPATQPRRTKARNGKRAIKTTGPPRERERRATIQPNVTYNEMELYKQNQDSSEAEHESDPEGLADEPRKAKRDSYSPSPPPSPKRKRRSSVNGVTKSRRRSSKKHINMNPEELYDQTHYSSDEDDDVPEVVSHTLIRRASSPLKSGQEEAPTYAEDADFDVPFTPAQEDMPTRPVPATPERKKIAVVEIARSAKGASTSPGKALETALLNHADSDKENTSQDALPRATAAQKGKQRAVSASPAQAEEMQVDDTALQTDDNLVEDADMSASEAVAEQEPAFVATSLTAVSDSSHERTQRARSESRLEAEAQDIIDEFDADLARIESHQEDQADSDAAMDALVDPALLQNEEDVTKQRRDLSAPAEAALDEAIAAASQDGLDTVSNPDAAADAIINGLDAGEQLQPGEFVESASGGALEASTEAEEIGEEPQAVDQLGVTVEETTVASTQVEDASVAEEAASAIQDTSVQAAVIEETVTTTATTVKTTSTEKNSVPAALNFEASDIPEDVVTPMTEKAEPQMPKTPVHRKTRQSSVAFATDVTVEPATPPVASSRKLSHRKSASTSNLAAPPSARTLRARSTSATPQQASATPSRNTRAASAANAGAEELGEGAEGTPATAKRARTRSITPSRTPNTRARTRSASPAKAAQATKEIVAAPSAELDDVQEADAEGEEEDPQAAAADLSTSSLSDTIAAAWNQLLEDNSEVITLSGAQKLFNEQTDLGIDSIHPLLLAWKIGSATIGQYNKEDFIQLMVAEKLATPEELAIYLRKLEAEVIVVHQAEAAEPNAVSKAVTATTPSDGFSEFYAFCFSLMDHGSPVQMENVVPIWQLILVPYFPVARDFVNFAVANASKYRTVSKSLWSQLFTLCQSASLSEDGSDLVLLANVTEKWVVAITDYIKWTQSGRQQVQAESTGFA